MAAAVEVRTFWSALLSVLLKCIAALGFATPASRAAAGRADAQVEAQGQARTAGRADADRTDIGRTNAAYTDAVRIGGQSAPRIPAPRGYEPMRRAQTRTLPPTMKQRICAEAHGSSPSARSVRTGDFAEDLTAAVALAEAAASPAAFPAANPATSTAGSPAAGRTASPSVASAAADY